LLLLAAAFAVHALASRKIELWIFSSFPLLYIWFMTQRPSQFPRWVFPLLPFVAVAGAAALVAAVRLLRDARAGTRRSVSYAAQAASVALVIFTLWQPLWSGAVSFSRRVTPPTHTRVEAWMHEHAPPGSVVLLGAGWLDLTGSQLVVERVPDVGKVLDGGIEQLAGYDWVVVPELYFGNPTLKRLGFVQRFQAAQSFGGSRGYDYEVYAVPKLPLPVPLR
jgi:branched-subunit amino acid transport protein